VTVAQDFSRGVTEIIRALGSNIQYQRRTGAPVALRVAITSIAKDEGELINAVGIDGSTGYLLPITPAPVKFDTITTPGGTVYAVHHVSEILIDSAVIGYKLGLKQ